MKSHFADEERLREWRENSGKKTSDKYIFGKSHFADEERLREWRENSGKKTSDKYIFGKSHFEDEERLRGKLLLRTKRGFGNR